MYFACVGEIISNFSSNFQLILNRTTQSFITILLNIRLHTVFQNSNVKIRRWCISTIIHYYLICVAQKLLTVAIYKLLYCTARTGLHKQQESNV